MTTWQPIAGVVIIGLEDGMENHLLILLGLHPKVFTETLYALGVKQGVAISRVIAIATAGAREKAVETLLAPVTGQFHRLRNEYPGHFDGLEFNPASIRVARNHRRAIWDINDSGHSQAYLDLIMTSVHDIAARPETCLHAVVAGGRRTLSVYLAMVMQLLARRQDRLYHLVVSPWEVETNSDFYFPTRASKMMVTYGGSRFDANEVGVDLVDIPFIRLRNRFPASKLQARTGQQLLLWAQREINNLLALPDLTLERETLSARIADDLISLQPQQFCLYWYFADRDRGRQRPAHVPFEDFENYFEPSRSPYFGDGMLASLLERFDAIDPDGEMRRNFVAQVLDNRQLPTDWVLPKISKINERLRSGLSQAQLIPFYSISSVGARGGKVYGIKLEGRKISTPLLSNGVDNVANSDFCG